MELLSNSINSSSESLDIGENDLGWPYPPGGETEWQHERDLKCSWDLDRNGNGNGDNPGMNGNKFQLGHGLHGPCGQLRYRVEVWLSWALACRGDREKCCASTSPWDSQGTGSLGKMAANWVPVARRIFRVLPQKLLPKMGHKTPNKTVQVTYYMYCPAMLWMISTGWMSTSSTFPMGFPQNTEHWSLLCEHRTPQGTEILHMIYIWCLEMVFLHFSRLWRCRTTVRNRFNIGLYCAMQEIGNALVGIRSGVFSLIELGVITYWLNCVLVELGQMITLIVTQIDWKEIYLKFGLSGWLANWLVTDRSD